MQCLNLSLSLSSSASIRNLAVIGDQLRKRLTQQLFNLTHFGLLRKVAPR